MSPNICSTSIEGIGSAKEKENQNRQIFCNGGIK